MSTIATNPLGFGYHIQNVAQSRWLKTEEICAILSGNPEEMGFPVMKNDIINPQNGQLYIFDRKYKSLKSDGVSWVKKAGSHIKVQETYQRITHRGVEVLRGVYSRAEGNEDFKRRIYNLCHEIGDVSYCLVHYREDSQATRGNDSQSTADARARRRVKKSSSANTHSLNNQEAKLISPGQQMATSMNEESLRLTAPSFSFPTGSPRPQSSGGIMNNSQFFPALQSSSAQSPSSSSPFSFLANAFLESNNAQASASLPIADGTWDYHDGIAREMFDDLMTLSSDEEGDATYETYEEIDDEENYQHEESEGNNGKNMDDSRNSVTNTTVQYHREKMKNSFEESEIVAFSDSQLSSSGKKMLSGNGSSKSAVEETCNSQKKISMSHTDMNNNSGFYSSILDFAPNVDTDLRGGIKILICLQSPLPDNVLYRTNSENQSFNDYSGESVIMSENSNSNPNMDEYGRIRNELFVCFGDMVTVPAEVLSPTVLRCRSPPHNSAYRCRIWIAQSVSSMEQSEVYTTATTGGMVQITRPAEDYFEFRIPSQQISQSPLLSATRPALTSKLSPDHSSLTRSSSSNSSIETPSVDRNQQNRVRRGLSREDSSSTTGSDNSEVKSHLGKRTGSFQAPARVTSGNHSGTDDHSRRNSTDLLSEQNMSSTGMTRTSSSNESTEKWTHVDRENKIRIVEKLNFMKSALTQDPSDSTMTSPSPLKPSMIPKPPRHSANSDTMTVTTAHPISSGDQTNKIHDMNIEDISSSTTTSGKFPPLSPHSSAANGNNHNIFSHNADGESSVGSKDLLQQMSDGAGSLEWLDDTQLSTLSHKELETIMDQYITAVVQQMVQLAALDEDLQTEIDSIDSSGYSLLHYCSLYNLNSLIPVLVDKGADVTKRSPASGTTALHLAAGAGHFEVVRQLVEYGADVCAIEIADHTRPSDKARQGGHWEIYDYLLARERLDTSLSVHDRTYTIETSSTQPDRVPSLEFNFNAEGSTGNRTPRSPIAGSLSARSDSGISLRHPSVMSSSSSASELVSQHGTPVSSASGSNISNSTGIGISKALDNSGLLPAPVTINSSTMPSATVNPTTSGNTTSHTPTSTKKLSQQFLQEAFASLSLTDKCALSLSIGQIAHISSSGGGGTAATSSAISDSTTNDSSIENSSASNAQEFGSPNNDDTQSTSKRLFSGGGGFGNNDNTMKSFVDSESDHGNTTNGNFSSHNSDGIRSSNATDAGDDENDDDLESQINDVISMNDKVSLDVAMSMMGHSELKQVEDEVRKIQNNVRSWLLRKNYINLREAARTLQYAWREKKKSAAGGISTESSDESIISGHTASAGGVASTLPAGGGGTGVDIAIVLRNTPDGLGRTTAVVSQPTLQHRISSDSTSDTQSSLLSANSNNPSTVSSSGLSASGLGPTGVGVGQLSGGNGIFPASLSPSSSTSLLLPQKSALNTTSTTVGGGSGDSDGILASNNTTIGVGANGGIIPGNVGAVGGGNGEGNRELQHAAATLQAITRGMLARKSFFQIRKQTLASLVIQKNLVKWWVEQRAGEQQVSSASGHGGIGSNSMSNSSAPATELLVNTQSNSSRSLGLVAGIAMLEKVDEEEEEESNMEVHS